MVYLASFCFSAIKKSKIYTFDVAGISTNKAKAKKDIFVNIFHFSFGTFY